MAALAQDAPIRISIPAAPLGDALIQLGEQASLQIFYPPDLVKGRSAPAVYGQLSPEQALQRLLEGTGITYRRKGNSITLLAADKSGAVTQLSSVSVVGAPVKDPTTEGTGSYTTNAMTIGKLPLAPREIPQSVSVMTRQRMDDQNMRDIDAVMTWAPGVYSAYSGGTDTGGHAWYYSRGYNLLGQYDGIPAYNANGALQAFDMSMYDRVEIWRGPSGLLQGSGEPGGVVNMVRKRPTSETRLSANLSLGSWDYRRAELDASGPLNESGTVRGRAVVVGQDQHYFYDRSHGKLGMAYGVIEADLTPDTLLTLSATTQYSKASPVFNGLPGYITGGLPDVSRSTNSSLDWTSSEEQTNEFYASLKQRLGDDWNIEASTIYRTQDGKYKRGYPTFSGLDSATDESSYYLNRDKTRATWFVADVHADGSFQALGRKHQLALGVNYNKYRLSDRYADNCCITVTGVNIFERDVAEPDWGGFGSPSKTDIVQKSLYGQMRLSVLDPLTVVMGGRLTDFEATTSYSHADASGKFTPYGGLIYDITRNWSLYGSYSDIFIPQTQQTFEGSVLKPRVGRQYEVGAKGSFFDGALNASIAAFDLRDRNRSYADPAHSGYYLAAGEVQSRGWETEVSGSPMRGWNLSAGYTFMQTRYLKDPNNQGAAYSTAPKHSVKVWSDHDLGALLPGLDAGVGVRVFSRGGAQPYGQGGYAVVDMRVGYRINAHLSAALNIGNLLDRKYWQSLGGGETGNIYGTPRNVMLTLRATY
ncbi:TonB-dependent siderophore receptor [Achromobacter aloeverae]